MNGKVMLRLLFQAFCKTTPMMKENEILAMISLAQGNILLGIAYKDLPVVLGGLAEECMAVEPSNRPTMVGVLSQASLYI